MLRKMYNKWKMNGLKAKYLAKFPNLVLDPEQLQKLEASIGWLAIKQQIVHSIDQCYDKLKNPTLPDGERMLWLGRLGALETVYGLDRHVEAKTANEIIEMEAEDSYAMENLNQLLRRIFTEH